VVLFTAHSFKDTTDRIVSLGSQCVKGWKEVKRQDELFPKLLYCKDCALQAADTSYAKKKQQKWEKVSED